MTGDERRDPTSAEEHRLRSLLRMTADTTRPEGVAGVLAGVTRRVHRRRWVRALGAGAAVTAAAAATVLVATAVGPSSPEPPTAIGPYRLTGALTSFHGCHRYLNYVRDRAERTVGPYGLNTGGYPLIYNDFVGRTATDLALHAPVAAPAGVSGAPLASPAPAYSTTNNQVAGVDEPDSVKTDGHLVVTLTGSTLRVLDTDAHVLGSLRLDGDTSGGMLLDGDRVVVLSSGDSERTYGWGGVAYYPANQPAPTARVAIVDLSQPKRPTLLRTFLFDGTAVAARLVGGQVRLVLRSDGPRLKFDGPSEGVSPRAAERQNRQLIAKSNLGDWLPTWQVEAPNGSTTARHRLTSCDAIARPRKASGVATESLLSLDPAADAPGVATSVVAAGETVYASTNHVYVAGVITHAHHGHGDAPGVTACCTNRRHEVMTRIYDFATSVDGPPQFVAAGRVAGTLLSSYAMDEDTDGLLRVASTTQHRNGHRDSRITVLRASGRLLTEVGHVGGLGNGEQLRAVRFVGDLAYVTTFRSIDPMYVVDLRDPARPRVVGQLTQRGYNEFLYPLPHDRLLSVGVQTRRNEPERLTISTYDVYDPAHPRRIDSAVLAHGFAAASGTFDPHAFLSWPADHLVVTAVPNGGGGAAAYRLRSDGTLLALATLAHNRLNPSRALVIGDHVWTTTAGGVITARLPNVTDRAWHPY